MDPYAIIGECDLHALFPSGIAYTISGDTRYASGGARAPGPQEEAALVAELRESMQTCFWAGLVDTNGTTITTRQWRFEYDGKQKTAMLSSDALATTAAPLFVLIVRLLGALLYGTGEIEADASMPRASLLNNLVDALSTTPVRTEMLQAILRGSGPILPGGDTQGNLQIAHGTTCDIVVDVELARIDGQVHSYGTTHALGLSDKVHWIVRMTTAPARVDLDVATLTPFTPGATWTWPNKGRARDAVPFATVDDGAILFSATAGQVSIPAGWARPDATGMAVLLAITTPMSLVDPEQALISVGDDVWLSLVRGNSGTNAVQARLAESATAELLPGAFCVVALVARPGGSCSVHFEQHGSKGRIDGTIGHGVTNPGNLKIGITGGGVSLHGVQVYDAGMSTVQLQDSMFAMRHRYNIRQARQAWHQ
jgi:hypothetical protein